MPTPFQMLVAIRDKFGKGSREYQKFKEANIPGEVYSPVQNKSINDKSNMTEEEIYNEHEAYLNHIFVNSSSEAKSYNVFDDIYEFIDFPKSFI